MARKTRIPLRTLKNIIERRSILLGMFTAWLAVLSVVGTPYLFARLDYDSEQKKDKDQDKTKQSLEPKSALQGLAVSDLSEDEAILHAFNRIGFGPRPGDVERVRKMGLKIWIEQQLNPEQMSDGSTNARLEKYPTLKMSSAKLLAEFRVNY